ncbi:unnamed protein product [Protopolystoma xenopodis]|uniref:Uncharacterized protein n=1 Tax=Protopolystoma xenopodis TaxID=117903 RepID=A0A3S4ZE39_9PLAT|nr:unnamed protein product [Protopolystoma xenopodis]
MSADLVSSATNDSSEVPASVNFQEATRSILITSPIHHNDNQDSYRAQPGPQICGPGFRRQDTGVEINCSSSSAEVPSLSVTRIKHVTSPLDDRLPREDLHDIVSSKNENNTIQSIGIPIDSGNIRLSSSFLTGQSSAKSEVEAEIISACPTQATSSSPISKAESALNRGETIGTVTTAQKSPIAGGGLIVAARQQEEESRQQQRQLHHHHHQQPHHRTQASPSPITSSGHSASGALSGLRQNAQLFRADLPPRFARLLMERQLQQQALQDKTHSMQISKKPTASGEDEPLSINRAYFENLD